MRAKFEHENQKNYPVNLLCLYFAHTSSLLISWNEIVFLKHSPSRLHKLKREMVNFDYFFIFNIWILAYCKSRNSGFITTTLQWFNHDLVWWPVYRNDMISSQYVLMKNIWLIMCLNYNKQENTCICTVQTHSVQLLLSVSVRSPRVPYVCPCTTTWNSTLLPWPSPRKIQPVVKLPRSWKSSAAKRHRGRRQC